MYHVVVSDNRKVIAETLSDGLAEAVLFGHKAGRKGNSITVYDAIQDATGEIVHLNETLSMILEENHKEYS